jgi:hypothetical protein
VVSFVSGWIAGELAFQTIVWQMAATALFAWLGALDGWAGWLGLAVAAGTWVGLLGLGFVGLRAGGVTSAALAEVRTGDFPVPAGPTPPTWGRWWRVSRALPLRSRGIEIVRGVDYWGDGDQAHRLDVYRSWSTSTAGHG